MEKLVVIDYNIGNVYSVCNALKAIGCEPILTRDEKLIREADRLILPGVGAYVRAKEALESFSLPDLLKEFANTGRPLLGICIGMQLLMDESTEFGVTKGLGFIPGKVDQIPNITPDGQKLRVPHISWANLQKPAFDKTKDWEKTALGNVQDDSQAVYFVHSYQAKCSNPDHVLAEVSYGGNRLTAAIQKDNIIGYQFHPERSGIAGQQILQHFLTL